jgi:hypothetical protein
VKKGDSVLLPVADARGVKAGARGEVVAVRHLPTDTKSQALVKWQGKAGHVAHDQDALILRPAEPSWPELAWYRGWECGYEGERAAWTGEGYTAYKGGADLDVPQQSAATWEGLLDLIDDEEDEA